AIAMIGCDISDRIAVGNHVSLEAPLPAQLVLKQVLARAGRLPVDRVVSAHHRPGLSFHDRGAEGRLVGIDLIVLTYIDIGKVTRRLRPAVYGEMLWRRDGEVVLGVLTLQSGHVGNAHAAGEKRIFSVGLLPTAPARV